MLLLEFDSILIYYCTISLVYFEIWIYCGLPFADLVSFVFNVSLNYCIYKFTFILQVILVSTSLYSSCQGIVILVISLFFYSNILLHVYKTALYDLEDRKCHRANGSFSQRIRQVFRWFKLFCMIYKADAGSLWILSDKFLV